MSGSPLIAKPAAPASPVNSVLAGDGWWPDIDCTAMREALRIGEMVTHARLIATLESAVITVTDDLIRWRATREAQGITALALVEPSQQVNGKPRAVVLFTSAVRYAAAAELAEFSVDMSAAATDETRSDAKRDMACFYEKLRLQSVRSLLGVTRVAVELI